jgi:hypothetical protein
MKARASHLTDGSVRARARNPSTPTGAATTSGNIREPIKRFGEYATDGLINPFDACDPHLDLALGAVAQAA